jgi:hypothetical protein
MKPALFFLLLCCASTAFSQDFQPDLQKLMDQRKGSDRFSKKQSDQKQRPSSLFSNGEVQQPIVRSQQRVYSLPMDNMACVVPDTTTIAAMPNAYKKFSEATAGLIPNASPKQPQLIPFSAPK